MYTRRPGDWDCDICGFHNFGRNIICKQCTGPRATLEPSSYDNNNNNYNFYSYSYKPGDWNCTSCNFPNFASRNYCKQCGKEKQYDSYPPYSPYSYKPGDWNCNKCNFPNFASRDICKNCGASPMTEPEQKQKFKYLVVLDFEATCNDPINLIPQEIIEWPAKIIDVENQCILKEEFHFYIKPRIHPKLSDFCINLTGITQSMVDDGDNIINVIKEWNKFCFTNALLPNDDNFDDNNNNIPNACIVTCGDWDLKNMWIWQSDQVKNIQNDIYTKICCYWLRDLIELENNNLNIKWIELISSYSMDKSLINPSLLHSWINIKVIYQNYYFEKAGGLMTMLKKLNIEHIGKHHSGIDDVTNLCQIILNLLNQGTYFDFSYTNWKTKNGINHDIEIKKKIKKEINAINTDYNELEENEENELEENEENELEENEENELEENEENKLEENEEEEYDENVPDEYDENVADEYDENDENGDKQKCQQCDLINIGKIDENDGLFYCNQCWDSFNV